MLVEIHYYTGSSFFSYVFIRIVTVCSTTFIPQNLDKILYNVTVL